MNDCEKCIEQNIANSYLMLVSMLCFVPDVCVGSSAVKCDSMEMKLNKIAQELDVFNDTSNKCGEGSNALKKSIAWRRRLTECVRERSGNAKPGPIFFLCGIIQKEKIVSAMNHC